MLTILVSLVAAVLVTLGLIERTERGGLLCSFDDIHVDMHLRRAA